MPAIIDDTRILTTLDNLYQQEADQQADIQAWFKRRIETEPDFNPRAFDAEFHRFFADKMVALERIKAEFCFQVCRSLRARRIVEVGTSFGVSTIFLAAALRQNLDEDGGKGRVFASEYEPAKAAIARSNFADAGIEDLVDLREGDILTELADVDGPIDFVLMDIWGDIPRPLIEQLHPRLRPGAVVIADNSSSFRAGYKSYFEFINNPANGYSTMTLPFDGGLEFTVKRT